VEPTLTRAEVARFTGKSPTRIAYSISKGWLKAAFTTELGTEIFWVRDVLQFAKERGISLPEAQLAG
jgi:hypothetical protein